MGVSHPDFNIAANAASVLSLATMPALDTCRRPIAVLGLISACSCRSGPPDVLFAWSCIIGHSANNFVSAVLFGGR